MIEDREDSLGDHSEESLEEQKEDTMTGMAEMTEMTAIKGTSIEETEANMVNPCNNPSEEDDKPKRDPSYNDPTTLLPATKK